MDKKIYLSIVCVLAIGANAADLGTIDVTGVTDTKIISNVSNEDVKSADLAEALYKEVPSINLIRRSGIANDITLRGQKRDNIVVTMDDSKVCGACPNRMDPPTSHIVTANINSVKVSEGPYDVEEFGNLSGSVKVTMKKPTKKLKGNVESTIGSFGYRKVGASVSGGNDKVRLLLTGSYENSEQYKDGSGNTVSKQIDKAVTGTKFAGYKFQDRYKDMDAYTKKTAMAKVYVDVNDKQDMQLSYTANRSDDVLYGNSKMDAIYDNSDIINFKYTIRDLNI
jgi:iron complex outermembrane receptor protein